MSCHTLHHPFTDLVLSSIFLFINGKNLRLCVKMIVTAKKKGVKKYRKCKKISVILCSYN